MTTLSTYVNWSEKILNEHLKTEPKWLATCSKVNRYTRAGKDGKIIVCPECNKVATVYHFSWSALGCQECGAMVEKNQWRLL